MENKPVLIYGYELCTPKYLGNSMDMGRYDNETVEVYLKRILDLPLKERVFLRDNKMMNLVSFKNSHDQDFLEGVFITARYGKVQDIIDVIEQNKTGEKGKNQGARNEVHFIIHKKTGLLLVEKDTENVARGNFIKSYFIYHRERFKIYSDAFNKKFSPEKVYKRGFIQVVSLPSKTFFEEIEQFVSIKEAFVYKDIEQGNANNAASNLFYLAHQAEEDGVENISRVKMSFENKVRKSSIRHIRGFFEKLHESQHYDGLGVSGKLGSGRQRTIELENIQRAFDLNIDHNENGLPSLEQLINGMIVIGKMDNPLQSKADIDQFKGVEINVEEEDSEG